MSARNLGYCCRFQYNKFILRITIIVLVTWFLLAQIFNTTSPESLTAKALAAAAEDPRYAEVYRKPEHLPKNIKYILLYTDTDYEPFGYFKMGQVAFIENNCSSYNCYVTDDKSFFQNDITKFHAIAFNGRTLPAHLPSKRAPHQKYIYYNTEAPGNHPIWNPAFDGFFNWTSTFRLDSDIPYPYILVRNSEGDIVGPKINMTWIQNMQDFDDEEFYEKIQNKTKAAAWFVSNCYSKSKREKFVSELQEALDAYGWTIDIYGYCGTFKCPRSSQLECDRMLSKDYYFYLALENSFDIDYVTEKPMRAIHNGIIPIVFGGANYSRFFPPHSYLDGRAHTPAELASIMDKLMKSPTLYAEYFRWRNYYTFHDPFQVENVCALCDALNNQTLFETPSVYTNIRKWWNDNQVLKSIK